MGGVPLEMTAFYGIRIYEHNSTLAMHVDRANTHVISSILHIDHDYGEGTDSWPIEIVDLHGKVQAVELLPGEMLLYESSKCQHGRPKPFLGRWYASAFLHFRPRENWPYDNGHRVAAVPPHFNWPLASWKQRIYPRLIEHTNVVHADL